MNEMILLKLGEMVLKGLNRRSFEDKLQANIYRRLNSLGQCRFQDCAHVKEKGCAVLAAVKAGEIPPTRHQSYVRLYEQAKAIPDWERKRNESL